MADEGKLEKRQLVGVFLVSMGVLALEVVLTRIFSVTMWYHFAFLAISLALMGSAAAGVLLYFFPRLSQPQDARRWIAWLATALALSVPITFLLYLQIPFQPVLLNRSDWLSGSQLWFLALIYLVLAIPFFLAGLVLSLALSAWPARAGWLYGADLTGASLGCLLSIVALERLGGPGALLFIGALLATAGVAFSHGWSRPRRLPWWPIAGLLLLLGLWGSNQTSPWLKIRVDKLGGAEPTPIYEHWNAHSRVTVYEPVNYPFFWAIDLDQWAQVIETGGSHPHALLLIDAVAGTPIQNFHGNLDFVSFLRYDLTSLVYHLIDRPHTLVIGPGGGRDVLAALAVDAPHVTAIEVNPAIIDAVRGPFADFAGELYERPDVTVVVADARGYIDRSPQQYDVIQASLIDTWAAGGSGAFALSENSLYTLEAFKTYHDHLSDRGILAVSRWYLPERPAETLRLVATGMAGWEAAGVNDPRQHVAVAAHTTSGASTEGLSTALFKKQPFTPEEVATLQTQVEALGFNLIYAPGIAAYEEVGQFIAAGDHPAFIANYVLDISPATDDRPFFFNLVLLGDLLDPSLSGSGVYRTSMEAILILFAVIGVSALFAVLFIILPLGLGTWRGGLARPSGALLTYFAALGLGFMVIEIPTIQKFTVYLGRPVYSLAIVLFSLLLFSGLGSLWSGTWRESAVRQRIYWIFPALIGATLVHATFSRNILELTLGLPLAWRVVTAGALLAPLGFLLGIPFPTGIRWAGQHRAGVIPWLWGMNGVMSVLGAALATTLSIHVGFRTTLLFGTAVYTLAGFLLLYELRAAEKPGTELLLKPSPRHEPTATEVSG